MMPADENEESSAGFKRAILKREVGFAPTQGALAVLVKLTYRSRHSCDLANGLPARFARRAIPGSQGDKEMEKSIA